MFKMSLSINLLAVDFLLAILIRLIFISVSTVRINYDRYDHNKGSVGKILYLQELNWLKVLRPTKKDKKRKLEKETKDCNYIYTYILFAL